jgi:DedD protein
MGLMSFLQRRPPATSGAGDTPTEIVERARAQARRRLIGAIVLVGVGIVAFPILFETQPRPIPVDLPIVIPKKDAVPPLMPAAPRTDAAAAAKKGDEAADAARAESGGDAASAAVRAAPAAVASAPRGATTSAPASAPPTKPATAQAGDKPAVAREGAEGERARALLEARVAQQSAAAASAVAGTTRLVVQVGAYADADAAREVRQRVERLGVKTYVQEIQTDAGKRVRVRIGPFNSRDEAEKVVARVKAAGLPAAVVAP